MSNVMEVPEPGSIPDQFELGLIFPVPGPDQ